jgi:hypothetical protein
VVTKAENQAAKVEKFLVDVGAHPGEFLIMEPETKRALSQFKTPHELMQKLGLKTKLEKLEKDRASELTQSRQILGTQDYDPTITTKDAAFNYLSSLVSAVIDANYQGAYLFRTDAKSAQEAAFHKGQLAQVQPQGWVSWAASGAAKMANYVTSGYASYTLQRSGWTQPPTEYIISVYHKMPAGNFTLTEYRVPFVEGSLTFEGQKFDNLQELFRTVKAAKSLPDVKSVSTLKESKKRIDALKAVFESDAGYSHRTGRISQMLHFRTTFAPKVSSAQEAEDVLGRMFQRFREPTYVLYPTQVHTASGKPLYGLSSIDQNGVITVYQIDIWTVPGRLTVGQEQLEGLSDLLQKLPGPLTAYNNQWDQYQRVREQPLALQHRPEVQNPPEAQAADPAAVRGPEEVNALVPVGANLRVEEGADVRRLRHLYALSRIDRQPPRGDAPLTEQDPELWAAVRSIKNRGPDTQEKTIQLQSRKLLRYIFDLPNNCKLKALKDSYKTLAPIMHPDRTTVANANDLFGLLAELAQKAAL